MWLRNPKWFNFRWALGKNIKLVGHRASRELSIDSKKQTRKACWTKHFHDKHFRQVKPHNFCDKNCVGTPRLQGTKHLEWQGSRHMG
eukprot:scaffold311895_cov12-Tisochrysis_lutea.AAC.1